jgi:hypothetical protein
MRFRTYAICSVEGCERPHCGRGLCIYHHSRMPRSLWYDHKYRSRKRGIDFLFSFEDWANWWEEQLGHDWLSLRGCKPDQYVMARKGDKGPYSRDNVYCCTNRQNALDAWINTRSSRKKIYTIAKKRKKAYKERDLMIIFEQGALRLYKLRPGAYIEECEEPIIEGILEAVNSKD